MTHGSIPMSDIQPTPTAISAVCITVGDDLNMRARAHHDNGGSVFVGESYTGGVVQIAGSPAQLRSLAYAIYEGAADIAAQHAERTDADIARETA